MAIAPFAWAKASDTDGLPVEFYGQYLQTLAPRHLELFWSTFDTFTQPDSVNEALIILFSKAGKNIPSLLSRVLLSLVHADQSGFMPDKNESFNIKQLFMNLQAQHDCDGMKILLTPDAAKEFHSEEWCFYLF